jgi:hypothetical protein
MTENTVAETIVANENGAIYAMENVTSSNGALSGAKQHFADAHDIPYGEIDGTLFTKGYGPAEKVAAVKHD